MKKIILVTMILLIFSTTQYNITHTMDKPNKQAFIIQKKQFTKSNRPFPCTFCDKTFYFNTNRNTHQTHVGIIKH